MNINLYKINKYRYKLGLNIDKNKSVTHKYLQKYIYYLTGGVGGQYEKHGNNIIYTEKQVNTNVVKYSTVINKYFIIYSENKYEITQEVYNAHKGDKFVLFSIPQNYPFKAEQLNDVDKQANIYFNAHPTKSTITLKNLITVSRPLPYIPISILNILNNDKYNLQQIMNLMINTYSNQPESIKYFLYIPTNINISNISNISNVRIFSTEKKGECSTKDNKSFAPTYYTFSNCTFDIDKVEFTFNNSTDAKIKLQLDPRYIRTCLNYDKNRTYYIIDSSMIEIIK